jgi:hypothetical protein
VCARAINTRRTGSTDGRVTTRPALRAPAPWTSQSPPPSPTPPPTSRHRATEQKPPTSSFALRTRPSLHHRIDPSTLTSARLAIITSSAVPIVTPTENEGRKPVASVNHRSRFVGSASPRGARCALCCRTPPAHRAAACPPASPSARHALDRAPSAATSLDFVSPRGTNDSEDADGVLGESEDVRGESAPLLGDPLRPCYPTRSVRRCFL